ncbi:GDSL-type esterase/lipase family protein [Nodosilinea nodulosa]|uniref:GDSL-type esterase/lipase family protein n=1 Tax=Nodosilinea nodulosa TaxID=416001 RepID=UPI0002FFF76F|nr:GDSL-type esterase/lipase family protein [Nodosilinea nodulosa]
MRRLAPSIFLSLLGVAIAAPGHSANTPNLGALRPHTGGQLYVQRVATLQAGQLYSRIAPGTFAAQWQAPWQQPTHEQWQSLLAHEATTMAASQGQSPLAVVVGDSLCLWLPQEQLPRDRLWLNQSISGETTAHMVRRITFFASARPSVVYVMAGVNDLKTGVAPDVTVSNMELIVQRLRVQHPQARIVVLSILPTRLSNLPQPAVGQLNQQIAIAVQRRGATFVDLQPAFKDSQGLLRAELTTDGLHLNEQGYGLLTAYLGRI